MCVCDMTHSHVTCDMTHSYGTCDMTHSYVMCDMTHTQVSQLGFHVKIAGAPGSFTLRDGQSATFLFGHFPGEC